MKKTIEVIGNAPVWALVAGFFAFVIGLATVLTKVGAFDHAAYLFGR